jgi:hypothetical protein
MFQHRILGVLNLDAPLLGLHPGIVVAGLSSLFRKTPEFPQPYNSSDGPGRPPTDDPHFNADFTNDIRIKNRGWWKNVVHFVKKHNGEGLLDAATSHVMSHMEFGSCLMDVYRLKSKYRSLRLLEDVNPIGRNKDATPRVRFAQYYTMCHGYPKNKEQIEEQTSDNKFPGWYEPYSPPDKPSDEGTHQDWDIPATAIKVPRPESPCKHPHQPSYIPKEDALTPSHNSTASVTVRNSHDVDPVPCEPSSSHHQDHHNGKHEDRHPSFGLDGMADTGLSLAATRMMPGFSGITSASGSDPITQAPTCEFKNGMCNTCGCCKKCHTRPPSGWDHSAFDFSSRCQCPPTAYDSEPSSSTTAYRHRIPRPAETFHCSTNTVTVKNFEPGATKTFNSPDHSLHSNLNIPAPDSPGRLEYDMLLAQTFDPTRFPSTGGIDPTLLGHSELDKTTSPDIMPPDFVPRQPGEEAKDFWRRVLLPEPIDPRLVELGFQPPSFPKIPKEPDLLFDLPKPTSSSSDEYRHVYKQKWKQYRKDYKKWDKAMTILENTLKRQLLDIDQLKKEHKERMAAIKEAGKIHVQDSEESSDGEFHQEVLRSVTKKNMQPETPRKRLAVVAGKEIELSTALAVAGSKLAPKSAASRQNSATEKEVGAPDFAQDATDEAARSPVESGVQASASDSRELDKGKGRASSITEQESSALGSIREAPEEASASEETSVVVSDIQHPAPGSKSLDNGKGKASSTTDQELDASDSTREPAEEMSVTSGAQLPAPDSKALDGEGRETPPPPDQRQKNRKFCNLPSLVDGQRDPLWVEVYMKDVDEVAAHTRLFFPGPHYEKLVGDVGDMIVRWVQDDMTARAVLDME